MASSQCTSQQQGTAADAELPSHHHCGGGGGGGSSNFGGL
jgi:hypothetical protein